MYWKKSASGLHKRLTWLKTCISHPYLSPAKASVLVAGKFWMAATMYSSDTVMLMNFLRTTAYN